MQFREKKDIAESTYCKPLRVVTLPHAEESLERIVTRDDKSSQVGQQLASDVEENEEEVKSDKPEESIDLGEAGLFLEIIQNLILGKL
jgi:hypothetical protein